jgi:hypothetical protein
LGVRSGASNDLTGFTVSLNLTSQPNPSMRVECGRALQHPIEMA